MRLVNTIYHLSTEYCSPCHPNNHLKKIHSINSLNR
ncbi:hypothetical protein B6N60_00484 [Richelia sinica FACHB-800]|uniref:Uncharacterized protein n=1 Tax=Richelia sinica FACHB-800 TaxID=1357546 RepID=A0A975T5I2_9NOST|nr:hypothetical protein B6N60_00484 [Richelia sinica FACHB-800]